MVVKEIFFRRPEVVVYARGGSTGTVGARRTPLRRVESFRGGGVNSSGSGGGGSTIGLTSFPFAWCVLVRGVVVVVVAFASLKGDRNVAICSVVSFRFRAAAAVTEPSGNPTACALDGVAPTFGFVSCLEGLNSGRRVGVDNGVDDDVDVVDGGDGVDVDFSVAESREDVVVFLTFDFFDRETLGMTMEELSLSSSSLMMLLLSISLWDMSTFFFFFFRGEMEGLVFAATIS